MATKLAPERTMSRADSQVTGRVRLHRAEKEHWERIAAREGLDFSGLVRRCVREYLQLEAATCEDNDPRWVPAGGGQILDEQLRL